MDVQELLRCPRLWRRDEHDGVQLRPGARPGSDSPLHAPSTASSPPNTPSHARHLPARRTSSPAPERLAASTLSPYGLYLAHGYINPVFAAKTGFSEDDLELLWKALANLFELDRSAARGTMATRGLYIFKHECKLGNAQAQRLFESIQVEKKPDVESPRAFADYTVVPPDPSSLPEGITLIDGLA